MTTDRTDGSKKRCADDEEGAVSPPPLKRPLKSSTNATKVANFFKPASQKPPEKTKWREVKQSMLVASFAPEDTSTTIEPLAKRRKIASFDLDGTLITTLSGKVWAKDASDWKWWHVCVPGELRRLHREGYRIIIFSNQGSINLAKDNSKGPKPDNSRFHTFKSKVTAILNQLELPITVYAATGKDLNRKPRRGMWDEMLEDHDLDEGDGADMDASFFVGDAAGRSNDRRGDFAASDRDFAANIGIAFHTPEEYFLKQAVQPFTRAFDPAAYLHTGHIPAAEAFRKTNEKDIVVLCGSPGAGKSTFYWSALQPLGYERVNQDLLKTRDKCLKRAAEFLAQGASVAVDNTNADVATRGHWISLAAEQAVPIRCVYLQSDAKLSEHNDTVRALAGAVMNPEARSLLPKMAFTGFASRFEAPEVKEGFEDVLVMPFRFAGTDEQKAIWTRFWV